MDLIGRILPDIFFVLTQTYTELIGYKENWFNKLPKPEDAEVDMIDMAYEPKKNSRLSCQIIVSDELDGLIVNIPSKQG